MKKSIYFLGILAFTVSLLFLSCNEPDTPDVSLPFEKGAFISNEGVFQTGTGSISFLDREKKIMDNDIFQDVNNRPVGNVLNDIVLFNDYAYLVVNNAQKIEVVSYKDFKSVGVINGLNLPSKFLGINASKAYVSQWGASGVDGSVEVIDLSTNAISSSIPTGSGSGNMIMINDKVFVANKGGFAYDSNLTVINTSTDKVTDQLFVGYNPNSLALDKNGMLWVLCEGKWKSDWTGLEHPGKLVKIDPADNSIKLELAFSSTFSTPTNLEINKEKSRLFFIYSGGVYSMNVDATTLESTAFIAKSFYSIGFDEEESLLYGGDAKDYVSNGYVFRYDVSGTLVDSFEAGIIPGDYYFN